MNGRVIVAVIALAVVLFTGFFGIYYMKNISMELVAIIDDMGQLGENDTEELQYLFSEFKKEYKKYNTAITIFGDNSNIFQINSGIVKVEKLLKNGMSEELLTELGTISSAIKDVYERMCPNLKNIL